jgi:uncharacterized Fe-S cluster-containing radical SAM superfamily protein
MTYTFNNQTVNSVELKCLLVSRGVSVDKSVYKALGEEFRLNINPLTCNCLILPDGTIAQLTDVKFHLNYLSGMLSWSNLKLLRYASELGTPFSIHLHDGKAALFHKDEPVCNVKLPPYTDFYTRKTTAGTPFIGNAVLQGLDWVSFQCLWHCEYAAAGKPCQFCFSGADHCELAKKGKPQSAALSAADLREVVQYGIDNLDTRYVQITGGSTFDGKTESAHIHSYLNALSGASLEELFLYITPPGDTALVDEYFSLGATRIACSLEVWDLERAKKITPGKIDFTTRERHLKILEYIADKHGHSKAYSNFIIGLEPFEALKDGATYLAERGIIPSASIWIPMGRPVMGSMTAPDLDYYRRVIELFGELYIENELTPALCRGLNCCMERDIWWL